MARNSCVYIPKVGSEGQPSLLYQGLLDKIHNRALVNLIYASYLQAGVADSMDAKGCHRDTYGQHSADDVYDMFDVNSMLSESARSLSAAATSAGIMDTTGKYINFATAEEAYSKAQDFNNKSQGRVASVFQHDDYFNVVLFDRDANTNLYQAKVDEEVKLWNEMKAIFNSMGVSLSALASYNKQLFVPAKIGQAIDYINRIQKTSPARLTSQDLAVLLTLGANTSQVSGILSRGWGDVSQTAERMYNILTGKEVVGPSIKAAVDSVVAACQNTSTFDTSHLTDEYNRIAPTILNTSQQYDIQRTVDDLDRRFNIGKEVVIRKDDTINMLSHSAQEAIITLQRQLDVLKKREGNTAESEKLTKSIQAIANQLDRKQYYAGLLNFLSTAVGYLRTADSKLRGISTGGTMLDYCKERAHTITQLRNLREGYYDIVTSLSNIETLAIDENLSAADIQTLKQQATEIKALFDSQEKVLNEFVDDTMLDIYGEVLGTETFMGESITNLLAMAKEDSTVWDNLYSMGRVSNPMISGLNRVIRTAQDQKVQDLRQVALKIRRINDAFRKAGGKDTAFMYEKDADGNYTGRIVSEYNWDAFYRDKTAVREDYKRRGYRGLTLKNLMDQWEIAHTEEVVVDSVSGRTERMPSISEGYGNSTAFDSFTAAQMDYYNAMMQVKGELGTLLPEYARMQYRAPQVRKSWRDVINDAVKKRISAKDAARLLWDKMKLWKAREDDTEVGRAGIINDVENAEFMDSNFDDTPVRNIPIYHINRLKDQADLMLDFSGGLQALANTAINYKQMEDVKELVEVTADYVKHQAINPDNKKGKASYTRALGDAISYFKRLRKGSGATRTQEIVDGFIDQYFYGNSMKSDNAFYRMSKALIGYNSYKGLAMNEKGAVSNYLVGEAQMLIEAGAGQYYTLKEFGKAHARLWGDYTVRSIGQLSDYIHDNKNSKLNLLSELFDPVQETGGELGHTRYNRSFARKFFEDNSLMFGYEIGEEILHIENMYGVLEHEKVSLNGEIVPLIDAFEVTNKVDGNSELKIKDGTFRLDGSAIDDAYIQSIRENIRTVNQKTHGSMNSEDKGIIHRNILGRFAMNFRQWMVEHYSRRFRSIHFEASAGNVLDSNYFLNTEVIVDGETKKLIDAFDRINHTDGTFSLVLKDNVKTKDGKELTIDNLDAFRKERDHQNHMQSGFWTDYLKFVKDMVKGYKHLTTNYTARWDSMTDNERANVKRARTEIAIVAALACISWGLGDPEDHKGEFWYRRFQYQVKRLLQDEMGSTPVGFFSTANGLIRRPIPATSSITGLTYPVIGLMAGDEFDTIKSGRYKGWNKYERNFLKYTIPIWWQVEQSKYMDEDPNVFNIFESGYQMQ